MSEEIKARKVDTNIWYVKRTHWAEDKDGVARPIVQTENMTDDQMKWLKRTKSVEVVHTMEEMEK